MIRFRSEEMRELVEEERWGREMLEGEKDQKAQGAGNNLPINLKILQNLEEKYNHQAWGSEGGIRSKNQPQVRRQGNPSLFLAVCTVNAAEFSSGEPAELCCFEAE
jgi:hypothetical protein